MSPSRSTVLCISISRAVGGQGGSALTRPAVMSFPNSHEELRVSRIRISFFSRTAVSRSTVVMSLIFNRYMSPCDPRYDQSNYTGISLFPSCSSGYLLSWLASFPFRCVDLSQSGLNISRPTPTVQKIQLVKPCISNNAHPLITSVQLEWPLKQLTPGMEETRYKINK